MASLFLNGLSAEERMRLKQTLHATQHGVCFICDLPIDLHIHANAVDIDHVEPLKGGGKDDPSNFALTHSSCNRSKQASDLRVARVLARFDRIRQAAHDEGRTPNLSDVLAAYGGAKHKLSFHVSDDTVKFSLAETGGVEVTTLPLYEDKLSGVKSFFVQVPIEYLHHDDRINPRGIGGSLARLVEEFHRKRPQLHVALAWVSTDNGSSQLKVFDGQHKATAQVLLGARSLPVRVFVDPDPDTLLTANTNAGTTLRQVAFDKSVQRRLGSALFQDRLARYRKERSLPDDALSFSERDLVQYFKGESHEMKRYVLDSVRDGITTSADNKLRDFIEFGGKAQDKPFSYATVEKTFYSFLIYPDVLDTPLDWRAEEEENPRELEILQIVRLMNIVAEEIYLDQFDFTVGTGRLENRVSKGEEIDGAHLRAFRMAKEEIVYAWLRYVRQIVQGYFNMLGTPIDEKKLFQYVFPEPLWDRIRAYVANLAKLPVWVNRELAATAFGGKQTYAFWQTVFETGRTPQGQQVLAAPLNWMELIKEPDQTSTPAYA